RVVLAYLAALHDDFGRLLRFAKVIAAMSPEVAAGHEAERVWLSAQFSFRYQMLRAVVCAGVWPQQSLDCLSHMVSDLAVRMEAAIGELDERAAVVARMASSLDGRGLDVS